MSRIFVNTRYDRVVYHLNKRADQAKKPPRLFSCSRTAMKIVNRTLVCVYAW